MLVCVAGHRYCCGRRRNTAYNLALSTALTIKETCRQEAAGQEECADQLRSELAWLNTQVDERGPYFAGQVPSSLGQLA